jgi:hypothetical protein
VNTQELLAAIDLEIGRLQNARNILAGSGETKRRGRPPMAGGKPAETLSAAARQKIAEAQRKRWAAQKKQSK